MKNKALFFLIVDDDEEDRMIFKEALKEIDLNFCLLTAGEGQEALDLLGSVTVRVPDYIFLDINMPGMNGKTFLKELKLHDCYKNIPVVVYSTSSTKKDREDAHDLGAYRFLTKPTSLHDIVCGIKEVISLRQ